MSDLERESDSEAWRFVPPISLRAGDPDDPRWLYAEVWSNGKRIDRDWSINYANTITGEIIYWERHYLGHGNIEEQQLCRVVPNLEFRPTKDCPEHLRW